MKEWWTVFRAKRDYFSDMHVDCVQASNAVEAVEIVAARLNTGGVFYVHEGQPHTVTVKEERSYEAASTGGVT